MHMGSGSAEAAVRFTTLGGCQAPWGTWAPHKPIHRAPGRTALPRRQGCRQRQARASFREPRGGLRLRRHVGAGRLGV